MLRHNIIIIFLLALTSCSQEARLRRQVQNTIRASGFITDTAKMYRATASELAIYDLRPNETIAEIGFGTGWLTGLILLKYDSLNYFANDIDEAALIAIEPVTGIYKSLRKRPDSNRLVVVRGTANRSNLPAGTFDKIILRETFHHFQHPHEMLADLHALLKQEGLLFLYEPHAESTYYSRDCKASIFCRSDLLEFFTTNQFTLIEEHSLSDSPGNVPSWWLRDPRKITPKKVFVFRRA